MSDTRKTAKELIAENETLQQRVFELEAAASVSDVGNHPWTPGDIRWHSLVTNAPLLILVLDRELSVRFANHTDSGADSEQVVGKSIYSFCRPENEAEVREYVERVFQTGEAVLCELPVMRVDGQEHWFVSHIGPIFQAGKVVAVSVISHNVTARRQVEEDRRQTQNWLEQRVRERTAELTKEVEQRRKVEQALRRSEAKYKALVESSPDAVAMMDFELEELRNGMRPKAANDSPDGIDALRRASMELRRVMNWLRTPVLERFGIAEAIGDMATQMRSPAGSPEIRYDHAVQFRRLEPTLENSLFRIAQEAMTNAERHRAARFMCNSPRSETK